LLQMRPYQDEALAAITEARERGIRRQLVALPTGAGKTVIFSELARRATRPVLVLAHRAELVNQARDKLARAIGDDQAVAVEQASQHASAVAKVVVASIRSLRSGRLDRLRAAWDFEWVIYDECHHSPADDNLRVLRELGVFEADWTGTLVGFTATTLRGDGIGLDTVFEEIVCSRTISDLIAEEYLVPLCGFRVATSTDLEAVSPGTGGDFPVEELAEAVDIQERNSLVARSIQELARDRRTIVFCVTVAHAKHLARALTGLGVACRAVYGSMKVEERAQTLADFRRGDLAAITNIGVLTEGFDDPGVSCIAMARPTRSEGLYAQCIGRGTRLAEGKKDCLVLDFVDLSDLELVTLPRLHGMPTDLDLQGQRADEAEEEFRGGFQLPLGFEIPPGMITLAEIKSRAAAFDPISLHIDPEIRAISANGWCSLGSRGVVLHFQPKRGKWAKMVVCRQQGRLARNRYRVLQGDREMASFSRVAEAVEAVDYEIERMGAHAAASAHEDAAWRQGAVPLGMADRLARLRPPRVAENVGQALQHLAFAEFHENG
jgi:ATP-dependent helicase IRC3